MRARVPWSVKGIEPEARAVAKQAAQRAGMTLGSWLNHVILEQNMDEMEFEANENYTNSLKSSPFPSPSRQHHTDMSPLTEVVRELVRKVETSEKGLDDTIKTLATKLELPDEALASYGPEKLDTLDRKLRHVIDRLGQAGKKNNEEAALRLEDIAVVQSLEKAVSAVVDHLETAEKRNESKFRDVQQALEALAMQENDDTQMAEKPANTEARMLVRLIQMLATRIDSIEESVLSVLENPKTGPDSSSRNSVQEEPEKTAEPGPPSGLAHLQNGIETLANRLEANDSQVAEIAKSVETSLAETGAQFEKLQAQPVDIADEVMQRVDQRLEEFDARLGQQHDLPDNIADEIMQRVDQRLEEFDARLGQQHDLPDNIADEIMQRVEQRLSAFTPEGAGAESVTEERIVDIQQSVQDITEGLRQNESRENTEREQLQTAIKSIEERLEKIEQHGQLAMENSAEVHLSGSPDAAALGPETAVPPGAPDAMLPPQAPPAPAPVAPSMMAAPPPVSPYDPTAQAMPPVPPPSPVPQAPVMPQPMAPPAGPAFVPEGRPKHDFISAARRAAQVAAGEEGQNANFMASPQQEGAPKQQAGPVRWLIILVSVFVLGAMLLAGLAFSGLLRLPEGLLQMVGGNEATIIELPDNSIESPATLQDPEINSEDMLLSPDGTQFQPQRLPEGEALPSFESGSEGPDTQSGSMDLSSTGYPDVASVDTRKTGQPSAPVIAKAVNISSGPFLTGQKKSAYANEEGPQSILPADPDPGKKAPSVSTGLTLKIPKGLSLRKAAEQGHAEAQYAVGMRYAQGKGVPQDFKQAAFWLEKAAEQDIAAAQYRLATLYEEGHGVDRSYARAKAWYERAAMRDNVKSMHNLAAFYAEGKGVVQDFSAAARWFNRAAQYGLGDSQFNAAVLYERGLGVGKDPARAFFWFSIAAKSGDSDAIKWRDTIAGTLSPDVLAEARLKIETWTPRVLDLAANGNFDGLDIGDKDIAQAESADVSSQIARAQALLARLGYKTGPADGVMGPRTRDSIRSFQQAAGLAATGEVNGVFMETLENYIR